MGSRPKASIQIQSIEARKNYYPAGKAAIIEGVAIKALYLSERPCAKETKLFGILWDQRVTRVEQPEISGAVKHDELNRNPKSTEKQIGPSKYCNKH